MHRTPAYSDAKQRSQIKHLLLRSISRRPKVVICPSIFGNEAPKIATINLSKAHFYRIQATTATTTLMALISQCFLNMVLKGVTALKMMFQLELCAEPTSFRPKNQLSRPKTNYRRKINRLQRFTTETLMKSPTKRKKNLSSGKIIDGENTNRSFLFRHSLSFTFSPAAFSPTQLTAMFKNKISNSLLTLELWTTFYNRICARF